MRANKLIIGGLSAILLGTVGTAAGILIVESQHHSTPADHSSIVLPPDFSLPDITATLPYTVATPDLSSLVTYVDLTPVTSGLTFSLPTSTATDLTAAGLAFSPTTGVISGTVTSDHGDISLSSLTITISLPEVPDIATNSFQINLSAIPYHLARGDTTLSGTPLTPGAATTAWALLTPTEETIPPENINWSLDAEDSHLTCDQGLVQWSAFSRCSALTGKLILPDSINNIGQYAFYICPGLSGPLTLPSHLIDLGSSAFHNCSNLSGKLFIPLSLTAIGENAFYSCSKISLISCAWTSLPTSEINDNAFNAMNQSDGTVISASSTVTSSALLTFLQAHGLANAWHV